MMREILFRAKRFDTDEWVFGTPFQEYDKFWQEWEWIIQTKHPLTNVPFMHLKVYRETISEFSGLTDKNGNKIFEGDIVLYPWNDQDNPEIFTIKFKNGQFVASPVKGTEYYWDFMVGGYSKEMEVIGNIHDNPELIGGKEDGN